MAGSLVMVDRKKLANAIRVLAMDAVQKAGSGHPGAPMGMADMAEVLWRDFLSHNPNNPDWFNRDRFVLSNGHASMLIYALLHLTGYDLSIEDIKSLRQLGSKTPGHPEFHYTPGIETTTGPLGQGLANAVGMALAEKVLAQQFNRAEFNIVDHYTYAFTGDGCLMEGISHEVCSLAGTLKLGKLIVFYDDNGISIDGDVKGWFSDDTVARFRAYGWHVLAEVDGHDSVAISKAIEEARYITDKPSLICCKTEIGMGAPNKQGSEACHGSPLGVEEIEQARKVLGWYSPQFEIDDDIYHAWDMKTKGSAEELCWNEKLEAYKEEYPDLAKEFSRRISGALPANFVDMANKYIELTQENGKSISTRSASLNTLNAYGPILPEILGGSADLAGSNLTFWEGSKAVSGNDPNGNYVNYGVREFGMSAIMNGIALQGGFIPYGGTFLTFMEYARNAVRMAALMNLRSIFVYTHDSIGLGEDGPTHQPIEQLANLRTTPGMNTWRPCDAVETAVAWKQALTREGATALVFSRQSLPHQRRSFAQMINIHKGAYILRDTELAPEAIVIATGSEVGIAMEAAEVLFRKGCNVRVVSMPAPQVFDEQGDDYKEEVLPNNMRVRVAVEAAHVDYWTKYVGLDGDVVGMTTYGESAPAKELYDKFGITVENVVLKVESLLS